MAKILALLSSSLQAIHMSLLCPRLHAAPFVYTESPLSGFAIKSYNRRLLFYDVTLCL